MDSHTQKAVVREGVKHRARTYQFKALLQRGGWLGPAFIQLNERGIVQRISHQPIDDNGPLEKVNGYALPGFQNAHSHAFQYAMAGMAEKHPPHSRDDFWSWREAMYAFALSMTPDQIQAIATMLYVEMLKRGYTSVAEFQYLHHDRNGKRYGNLSEMSVSLVAAAAVAGIRITLIPVYYKKGGFGKDAGPSQRRFCFADVEEYFRMLEQCTSVVRSVSTSRVGFGVHSLRAADPDDVIRIVAEGPQDIPFHIHAAEQLQEVDDSVAHLKQRPVEWLLGHLPIDERFHLIHCTHLIDQEVVGLAKRKAHVVLCPGTEANLGDGIFRLADFAQQSGRWSIGTDSHISLNPLEDLRWLDYTQRLTTHRRNTLGDNAPALVANTFFSGRRAMGQDAQDYFEVGAPFDAVVYDGNSPLLNTAELNHLLPKLLYTADSASVIGTMVNGEWIVKDQRHRHQQEALAGFQKAMKEIVRK